MSTTRTAVSAAPLATFAPSTSRTRLSRAKFWFRRTGWRHVVGIVLLFWGLFPLVYVVSTSFNTSGTLAGSNRLFRSFTLDNYRGLFNDPTLPYARWWINTLIVGIICSAGITFLSAIAAYAFSRMRFKGRRLGLQTVVIMQMFPQFLAVIALFLLMDSFGGYIPFFGIDTLAGLVLVYLGGALGVNTYLMYGYFNTIPKSLDEAAKLDGASHARVFFTIILPLVRPILVVVGVLSFIGVTGDFIIASVMLKSPENQTVAVGAVRLVSGERRNQVWGVFTASAVLAAVPLMVLWLRSQKHIVTGLSSGAVK